MRVRQSKTEELVHDDVPQKHTASIVFVSATNCARSISLMYRCTRSMAATMSSIRTRQSLGGTDRLCENASAELPLDGVLHDQVDRSAENALQLALHAEELEQPDRAVELDQEIHVASRTGFTSRDGTKKAPGSGRQGHRARRDGAKAVGAPLPAS